MLVRPISDLHLEHSDCRLQELDTDPQSVLILAGDITVPDGGSKLKARYTAFMQETAPRFKAVIQLMGNHEYYNSSYYRAPEKLRAMIAEMNLPNVHFLDRQSVVIDGVGFVGATLWTDNGNNAPKAVYLWNGMSDSRAIRTGPNTTLPYARKFSAYDAYSAHKADKKFMLEEIQRLKTLGHKVVAISHHGISEKSVSDEFEGHEMNLFFKSDMDMDIMDVEPDLWVHGHTHHSADYILDSHPEICKTRVIINPRGYPMLDGSYENDDFNPNLVIDI